MATHPHILHPASRGSSPIAEAAGAYDALATDYLRYADGENPSLFGFDGRYAYADSEIWARIDAALGELRAQGRHAVRILDLGCGPGTWTLRTALRARALGFVAVEARGIDISHELIGLARAAAKQVADPAIGLEFEVCDLETALAGEDDRSSDLTLCLYGVLNHLPAARHAPAAEAMARVTAGWTIATVRAVGSTPSIYGGCPRLSPGRRERPAGELGRATATKVETIRYVQRR